MKYSLISIYHLCSVVEDDASEKDDILNSLLAPTLFVTMQAFQGRFKELFGLAVSATLTKLMSLCAVEKRGKRIRSVNNVDLKIFYY